MRFEKKLIAGGIALALANGAQAGALGAANEIIIGGATAPQNFLREDILLRVCDPTQSIEVYVDEIENTGGASAVAGGELLQQGDHFVVRCTALNTFGSALDGEDVAIYKFNGGSATGVAPVSDPAGASAGDKEYMDASPANCGGTPAASGVPVLTGTGGTYDLYECPTAPLVTQAPDAGISDVEPGVFVGPLALSFGDEPVGVASKPTQEFEDLGNLQVKPGPGLIFGTAVTLPMYNELVDDQVTAGFLPSECASFNGSTQADRDAIRCMPSLPSGAIRSVFAGQVTSWDDLNPFGQDLDTSSVNEGDNVHICKRTNGSGTHAQFSIEFLGTNCRATSQIAMVEQNNGVSFAAGGLVGVYANSGSSDMSDCLDALGNGTGFDGDFASLPPTLGDPDGDSTVVPGTNLPAAGPVIDNPIKNYDDETKAFAMGYNSLEKNTSLDLDYRFVKVDWIPPTLEYAINGEYRDVYYLSFQNRVVGGSADLQTGGIRTSGATASQIAVADAYFDIWNNIDPAAIKLVNDTLVVDPDNSPASGDEWQGGFVTPTATAAFAYNGTDPATPWARQNLAGAPDSCQDLGLVR